MFCSRLMSSGTEEISDLIVGSLSHSSGNIARFKFSSAFILRDAKEFILLMLSLLVFYTCMHLVCLVCVFGMCVWYVCVCVCVCVCGCGCVGGCVHMWGYVCGLVYVCVHAYMAVYTHLKMYSTCINNFLTHFPNLFA